MDFLRRLLVKDPNLRMSTAVALAHPYISGSMPMVPAVAPLSSSPTHQSSVPSPSALSGSSGSHPSSVTTSGASAIANAFMGSLSFGIIGSTLDAVTGNYGGIRNRVGLSITTTEGNEAKSETSATDTSMVVTQPESVTRNSEPSVFTFSAQAIHVHQQQRQQAALSLQSPAPQNLCYTPGSLAAHAAAMVASGATGLVNTATGSGRFSTQEADIIINRYVCIPIPSYCFNDNSRYY